MTITNLGRIRPVPKGVWVSDTNYKELDVVSHNGSSYIRKVAGVGATTPNLDATNWDLLTEKGIKGDTGSQGVAGDMGLQGIQGDTGLQGVPGAKGDTGGVSTINTLTGDVVLRTINGNDLTGAGGDIVISGGSGGAITTVTLPIQSSVASPAMGNVVMYSQESAPANYSVVVETPNGVERRLQIDLCSGVMTWIPYGYVGNTSATSIGCAFSLSGAIARIYAATNIVTKSKRLGFISAATTSSVAGIYVALAGGANYYIGNLGDNIFKVRFAISDIELVIDARCFIGLDNDYLGLTNNNAPEGNTNVIALAQLHTDNTQWYIVYAGYSLQTPIALGTAIGAPTDTTILWEFEIFNARNINTSFSYLLTNKNTGVSVSGTVTGTAGMQIPSNSTTLRPRIYRTNNTTLLPIGLDICYFYGESGAL